jgi:hypothetical protein
VAGVIDPFGIADGANGLLYAAEGDVINAGISFASIAPGGDVLKLGRGAVKYGDEALGLLDDVVGGGFTYVDNGARASSGDTLFRTGSRTDNALTDPGGVFFRDSVSSSADGVQTFKPGEKIWAVSTDRLPPGSVIRDGIPHGHVTVNATPGEIRAATVDSSLLHGLRRLEDGTYRLPK